MYFKISTCLLNALHLTADTVNKLKQIFQIKHTLLRIPTGWRLTSWRFTQRGHGVVLGATENKSR